MKLGPTPDVYAQLPKPDGVQENSLPYAAWKCVTRACASAGMAWVYFIIKWLRSEKNNLVQKILSSVQPIGYHFLQLLWTRNFKLQSWLNQSCIYAQSGLLRIQQ